MGEDNTVPATPLVGSLSKAQFCTRSGHPISKPIWTDLSDWDILDRFGRICRNLFYYHSGSSKKLTLYRLKYILRLSCARTLARKHRVGKKEVFNYAHSSLHDVIKRSCFRVLKMMRGILLQLSTCQRNGANTRMMIKI
jgi:hypothetical protein